MRLFSTPLCFTHLESGLGGSLSPEGLGSSPGKLKLSSVSQKKEGSTAEPLPRPAAPAAPRFLALPTRERPSFSLLFLPLPLLLRALLQAVAQRAKCYRLPPPGSRAVGVSKFPKTQLLGRAGCARQCPLWHWSPRAEQLIRPVRPPPEKWAVGSHQLDSLASKALLWV